MRKHLTYANVMSTLAALFALTGGVAYAANTVFSADIVDGQVRTADLAANAVNSSKIADGQVTEADIGQGAVNTAELRNDVVTAQKVANESLVGNDVAANTLKGADIDESTLDIGDTARAYARVFHACNPECVLREARGISSAVRLQDGAYCVTAPGIDAHDVSPAVSLDWATEHPKGYGIVMATDFTCGPDENGVFRIDDSERGFTVVTERLRQVSTLAEDGACCVNVAGQNDPADNVSFTIVIP